MQQTVKWASGPEGGGWHSMNLALARWIEKKEPGLMFDVLTGGGRDNPTSLQEGTVQFATTIDFLSVAAMKGEEPYAAIAHNKLTSLGVGWSPLPFHFVYAPGGQPDLRNAIAGGKLRIAVPPQSTSDELTFQRVLAFYGTSYDQLIATGSKFLYGSYSEIVNAFADGEVDYVFGATTMPADAIALLGDSPSQGKLAPFPADLISHLSETYGYGRGSIGAASYPSMQNEPVSTTFMETVFLSSTDVPADLVYSIVRSLIAQDQPLVEVHPSLRSFDPSHAWKDLPVPLHPGAALAYREAGYMP